MTARKQNPETGGRPDSYDVDVAAVLCAKISEGRTLKSVCQDEGMPGQTTVFGWMTRHPEFEKLYARARLEQADVWADEIADIADTPCEAVKVVDGPTGTTTTYSDAIDHRRLRIESRKWLIARLRPERYGDKIQQVMTGFDGGSVKVEEVKTPKEAADAYSSSINSENK